MFCRHRKSVNSKDNNCDIVVFVPQQRRSVPLRSSYNGSRKSRSERRTLVISPHINAQCCGGVRPVDTVRVYTVPCPRQKSDGYNLKISLQVFCSCKYFFSEGWNKNYHRARRTLKHHLPDHFSKKRSTDEVR